MGLGGGGMGRWGPGLAEGDLGWLRMEELGAGPGQGRLWIEGTEVPSKSKGGRGQQGDNVGSGQGWIILGSQTRNLTDSALSVFLEPKPITGRISKATEAPEVLSLFRVQVLWGVWLPRTCPPP